MKNKGIFILFITLLSFLTLPSKLLYSQNQDIADSGWPKLFIDGNDSILMYQPQVDSWNDNDLIFRSAIGYIKALSNEQKYGVITFSAQTQVDKPNNSVYLSELQATNLNFPTIGDNGKKISYLILENLKNNNTISLSRLQADLSINQAASKQTVNVKNDPPHIFYSYNPSVLVIIDGDPITKKTTNNSFSKVINTSAFIIYNSQDGSYSLSLFGEWFLSAKITGPWILNVNGTKELDLLLSSYSSQDSTIQLFNPPSDEIKNYIAKGKQPKIFISTTSSELIIFEGQPQYIPVTGTNLLYASNTKADVFKNTTDNLTYILISGRWYSASDMKGPWTYVAPANLTTDFAKIPEDNPKANVLVSVPGTSQSKEAVISNQIPQTAKVKREKVNIDAVYDGEPQYKTVEGTNMEYIVNSPNPVIRIDGEYYMVKDGIWYFSDNYSGPWFVAFEVPVNIYSIPPDCPLYYVTYVRIYDYDDDFVYCGYTPGYFGCFVGPGNVVVYGTGWRYNPWLGNCWYGSPMTYGFGVSFFWSGNSGFYFNYGWGMPHPPFCRPWFGPVAYGPRGGYYGPVNHFNAYSNARNVVVPSSRMVNQARFENAPVNGNKPAFNEANKPGASNFNKPNDVFAGKDGNVYRPSNDVKASNIPQNQNNDNRSFPANNAVKTNPGSWQVNNGNNWQQFNKTPTNEQYHPTQVNNLNNNFNARSTGDARTSNFNQSFHGGESMGGGAHFSGGGGRR
jgi:hypothetical protein